MVKIIKMKERSDIKEIDVMDHIGEIMQGVKVAALITTSTKEKTNSMTISWGHIGIEWNKLIFIAYVRTIRFTHKMLYESNEFTINVGSGKRAKDILAYCGSKSGADVDKVKELDLTLIEGNKIATPGIKELPLTLECKVIYKQLQDRSAMPEDVLKKFYPENVPSDFSGSNRDMHTMFYGEILGGYIAL